MNDTILNMAWMMLQNQKSTMKRQRRDLIKVEGI